MSRGEKEMNEQGHEQGQKRGIDIVGDMDRHERADIQVEGEENLSFRVGTAVHQELCVAKALAKVGAVELGVRSRGGCKAYVTTL